MKPPVSRLVLAAALGLAVVRLSADPPAESSPPDRLDLRAAITYALGHNYTIQETREQIRQQQGVEIEVSARRLPSLTAVGGYTRNGGSTSPFFASLQKNWTISLQASQVLYAGGGVNSSVKSARLAREAAVLQLQGVINQQLLAVRTQFYQVLLNKARVRVQEQNVKLLRDQLTDARNRFAAGTTSNFDLLRAKVALANGQPPLIQAQNDYRVAVAQLRQLLGYKTPADESGTVLEVVGSLAVGQPMHVDLSDALAAARANRPELQRLAKLVQADQQDVTTARSTSRPELDLVGSYDWNRGLFSASLNDRIEGWNVGLQANWDIFDGRATEGRVIQARSLVRQAKLSLDDTTLGVEVQVRQAYSSLTEAWELVQASGKTVDQAKEALRLANVQYHAGTATQLDVLTSQVALTQARLNQLQAFYNYNVAVAGMREAMGEADTFVSQ